MNRLRNYMKTFSDRFKAAKEKGSLAAVLGAATVIAVVAVTLGAYTVGQVASAKNAEGQANMNAAISNVRSQISSELYRTGSTEVKPNDFYKFATTATTVKVTDMQVVTGTTPGVRVNLQADWRNGVAAGGQSSTQTFLIPLPPESVFPATNGTIVKFDSNGYACWVLVSTCS